MKTIIITGAGTGIGRATAIQLAAQGYSLILVGRRKEALEDTLDLLPSEGMHLTISADVSNASEFREALESVRPEQRNIYAIFANAGIGGENAYGEADRWGEILNVNLTGTYNSIMETMPYLLKSPEPFKHILITSSCLARFGVPNYTAYCTSKAGLLGLTRALAVELASQQILVNAICPGWVDTKMARQGIQLLADRADSAFEDEFNAQMSYVPLGRMSSADDIAHFVDYMFSPNQRSITGQGLDINNGSWMQ